MFFKMSLIGFLQMLSTLARMRCTLWSLACYYAGEPGSKSLQAPGIKKNIQVGAGAIKGDRVR